MCRALCARMRKKAPPCILMSSTTTSTLEMSTSIKSSITLSVTWTAKCITQGIENFWSLLKRGLNGTYVAVEPFHLFRYVDEQAFRFNNRKDAAGNKLSDAERFDIAVSQIVGKRLTFAEVTGKVGETTN